MPGSWYRREGPGGEGKRPGTQAQAGGWPGSQVRLGGRLRADFGTCCLRDSTALLNSGSATQHEGGSLPPLLPLGPPCLEEGTTPMVRPLPPRQTTGLGPGEQPRRRVGSGARQQQLAPLERPPGATAFIPRPPSQLVPRLQPTPQNTLLEIWSKEAVKGPMAGKSCLPLSTGLWDRPSGWGKPSMASVFSSLLCSRAQSPCRNTQTGVLAESRRPQGILLAREDCVQGGDLQWLWGSCTQIFVGAETYQFGGCHLSWWHQWDKCLLAFLRAGVGEFQALPTEPVLLSSHPPHLVRGLGCLCACSDLQRDQEGALPLHSSRPPEDSRHNHALVC